MVSKDEVMRSLRQAIEETFSSKGCPAPALTTDTRVDGSLGLDSLDWAAVVVRMEADTGLDPFAAGLDHELRTIGDIVDLYTSGAA